MRRGLIMAQKRWDLFKYNLKYKFNRGQAYDLESDTSLL